MHYALPYIRRIKKLSVSIKMTFLHNLTIPRSLPVGLWHKVGAELLREIREKEGDEGEDGECDGGGMEYVAQPHEGADNGSEHVSD